MAEFCVEQCFLLTMLFAIGQVRSVVNGQLFSEGTNMHHDKSHIADLNCCFSGHQRGDFDLNEDPFYQLTYTGFNYIGSDNSQFYLENVHFDAKGSVKLMYAGAFLFWFNIRIGIQSSLRRFSTCEPDEACRSRYPSFVFERK